MRPFARRTRKKNKKKERKTLLTGQELGRRRRGQGLFEGLRPPHGQRQLRELLDAVGRRGAPGAEAADCLGGGAALEERGDEANAAVAASAASASAAASTVLQPLLQERQQQLEELLTVLLLPGVEAQGPHQRRGVCRGRAAGLHLGEEAAEGADGGVACRAGSGGGRGAGGGVSFFLFSTSSTSSSSLLACCAIEPSPERRVGEEALEGPGDIAGGAEVEEARGDFSL